MKLKYSDKAHGYWLTDEGGKPKRCKSVTAVVSLPDDKSQLNAWKMRQLVIGLGKAPHLLDDVDFTHRGPVVSIVDEAMKAAGSSDAADYGTATHTVTEKGDRGEELDAIERFTYARWQSAIEAAGLEIVPELIEGVVVFPEERICGRFDRIARRRSDGSMPVVDLKTGQSAIDYPHSTVAQLATYANAPLRCDIGAEGDGETETFFKMPDEIDRKIGIVIHMPPEGDASVYEVNLTLGWAAMQQIIMPGLRWRAMAHSSLIKRVA